MAVHVFISGFKAQKIPDNLDAIVIGSGIGGLSTAVMLGRAGQKVLVLEQHDQAGGCCHTFIDKGYEFDTGELYDMGLVARKPVFRGLQTTQAQTSLHMRAG